MLVFIIAVLYVALMCAISWALTCGLVYLIMLCFGLVFSWKIATGIWLILFLLSCFFGKSSTSKK